ncbi:MAG: hypothetical protein ACRCTQ_01695 [Brevinemataceae bacterium]
MLSLPLSAYSQSSISNLITSIAVKEIQSNAVVLQWKSNKPSGTFSIYYNTNQVIKDKFVLRTSKRAISTNLTGTITGSLFNYEQQIPLPQGGKYYFAVIFEDSVSIDDTARGLQGYDPFVQNNVLIPNLNITIQPVTFQIKSSRFNKRINPQTISFPYDGYLVTSLNLKSFEDVFRLSWSVYPKDLSEYVFIIYRSKYPICQFGSPEGLPEYARVTNQFFFEDRNISFETPYYYAVVSLDSKQWDLGINLFTQPAVLVKNSPPFDITPKVEYIKIKEKSPVFKSEVLSEEDVEEAVRQTLSNLQIMPLYRTNQRLASEVLEDPLKQNLEPLTDQEISNLSQLNNTSRTSDQLYLQENSAKFQKLNLESDTMDFASKILLEDKNKILKDQSELEKKFLEDEWKDYKEVKTKFDQIKKPLSEFKQLERRLLVSDKLSESQFKNCLDNYFKAKDKLAIANFQLRGMGNGIEKRRSQREKKFLEDIKKIHSKALKTTKLSSIANGISYKVFNLDPNNINETLILGSVANPPSENINSRKSNLNYEKVYFDSDNNNFPVFQMPESCTPEERLEKLKSRYQDIPTEVIPTINDIPKEIWMADKERWLSENKNLWLNKQDFWFQQTVEILGEDYNQISSKWMRPSPTVALNEAQKALSSKKFNEALYLLSFVPKESANNLMMLGRIYYELKAYREAFSVFITAYQMSIPESDYWLERSAEKILNRSIIEKR